MAITKMVNGDKIGGQRRDNASHDKIFPLYIQGNKYYNGYGQLQLHTPCRQISVNRDASYFGIGYKHRTPAGRPPVFCSTYTRSYIPHSPNDRSSVGRFSFLFYRKRSFNMYSDLPVVD